MQVQSMPKKWAVLGLAPALALALTGPAQAAPYRTDEQAATYLKRHHSQTYASCMNGYYSAREQRTGRHMPQGRRDRKGRDVFASFACSMDDDRGLGARNVYVQTRSRGPWLVISDR